MHDPERTPTALLLAWRGGDAAALNELLPLLHHELRRIARSLMANERSGNTLQPTALVNEAYMRLVEVNRVQWQDRAHFISMAARVMRRVLVDAARARRSDKRGGDLFKVPLDAAPLEELATVPDLTVLHDALDALASIHRRAHDVVELRYFGGLSIDETAVALGVSPETVKRDWRFAKLWLLRELRRTDASQIT